MQNSEHLFLPRIFQNKREKRMNNVNHFRSFFFLITLSCTLFARADLEDHLRKEIFFAEGHTMRNIDFICMINLDQRPEKWQMSVDQLAPFGISPYRFSAVNGWELTLETINDVGLKFSPEMARGIAGTSYLMDGNFEPCHGVIENYGQTYFCHCMSRGAIGIALSHISILQNAYEAGFETIWVMEDDVDIRRDPRVLSDLIAQLDGLVGKENWDILFTDRDIRDGDGQHKACYWAATRPDFVEFTKKNDYYTRSTISDDFQKIGARWGAHSMIIRRCGMKKLLQFFKARQIFFPYDMEYILPPGIKLYTVLNDVVSNSPKAPSDNGGANYLNKGSSP
jgi:GR25 family glycosyltransferase involved in LPS biosynthesis